VECRRWPSGFPGDNNPSQPAIRDDKREDGLWANTGQASSKIRRFVPIEVRFVAEKKEAFQSFDPDEHFAGYPLSLDPEIIDEPVDGPDNVAAHGGVLSIVELGHLAVGRRAR